MRGVLRLAGWEDVASLVCASGAVALRGVTMWGVAASSLVPASWILCEENGGLFPLKNAQGTLGQVILCILGKRAVFLAKSMQPVDFFFVLSTFSFSMKRKNTKWVLG